MAHKQHELCSAVGRTIGLQEEIDALYPEAEKILMTDVKMD